jgi:hypothetical protein
VAGLRSISEFSLYGRGDNLLLLDGIIPSGKICLVKDILHDLVGQADPSSVRIVIHIQWLISEFFSKLSITNSKSIPFHDLVRRLYESFDILLIVDSVWNFLANCVKAKCFGIFHFFHG